VENGLVWRSILYLSFISTICSYTFLSCLILFCSFLLYPTWDTPSGIPHLGYPIWDIPPLLFPLPDIPHSQISHPSLKPFSNIPSFTYISPRYLTLFSSLRYLTFHFSPSDTHPSFPFSYHPRITLNGLTSHLSQNLGWDKLR